MSNLLQAVSVSRTGRVTPQNGTEVRIAVVGAAIWQAPDHYVVVVLKDFAGAQYEPAVGIVAVLQVERDGPAGTRAAVGPAAVVGPAVMEAHVAHGNDHRDLDDLGVVVGRVLRQYALQVSALSLREVPGHRVIAADLLPAVTAVDHRDGAHL